MNLCVRMWGNGHAQLWCACGGQRSTLACWSMPSILWGQGLFPVSCCLCHGVGLWFSRALPSLDIPCCRGAGITDMLRTCLYVSPWDYIHAPGPIFMWVLGVTDILKTRLYVSSWDSNSSPYTCSDQFTHWAIFPDPHPCTSPASSSPLLELWVSATFVAYVVLGLQPRGLVPPRPALTHVFSTSFLVLRQLACPHKSLATSSGNTSFKGQWFD